MSRSGYSDDYDDHWSMIRWRGAVNAAIHGKRGQQLLRELAEAMDAMPVRELISGKLAAEGQHCALGVVGAKRGLDLGKLEFKEPDDYEDHDWSKLSKGFNVAEAMAREIMYVNDDHWREETPAERWERVRKWVADQLKPRDDIGESHP